MASEGIHQAIHGYRDGHRLLSSSHPLNADATRAMLILSDMSGPSMQPGFDEYLTGYPLPSSDFFVLAKTWYAPEMQRPGCVWTHSLLIPRVQVPNITTACLLKMFRRPQYEGAEKAAVTPIPISDEAGGDAYGDGFGDRVVAASLVSAVLGQPRPVILVVDTAAQLETEILRLWEGLWPAERARFSFCTGALLPRSNAGALLDLQAVPRAIPLSQFRKSASAALFLDLRVPNEPEAWAGLMIQDGKQGNATFRAWLETVAGADAGRSIVPSLAPIFSDWFAPNASARSVISSIANAANALDSSSLSRLVEMAFDRSDAGTGVMGRRELLQDLCTHRDADLTSIAPMLEDQARMVFKESRSEGIALLLSLLGSELTIVGENVLRAAIFLLEPIDLEMFGDVHAQFLPTIVAARPPLASSPELWRRVGTRSGEILSQISSSNPGDEERGAVMDAILVARCDVAVDAFVRFGGKAAIFRALAALTAGNLQVSWPWRSALSAVPDTVLEWLESLPAPSLHQIEFGSRFLSPKSPQPRLVKVWKTAIAEASPLASRVAAFGLTLALWEGIANSSLLAACFQPTYDAAGSSRLADDEWEWLVQYAPSVSWYRNWDKCERIAAAVARLFEKQTASLETVFGVLHSRAAIMQVATFLDDHRGMRPYLLTLRNAAKRSSLGTREQRDALL